MGISRLFLFIFHCQIFLRNHEGSIYTDHLQVLHCASPSDVLGNFPTTFGLAAPSGTALVPPSVHHKLEHVSIGFDASGISGVTSVFWVRLAAIFASKSTLLGHFSATFSLATARGATLVTPGVHLQLEHISIGFDTGRVSSVTSIFGIRLATVTASKSTLLRHFSATFSLPTASGAALVTPGVHHKLEHVSIGFDASSISSAASVAGVWLAAIFASKSPLCHCCFRASDDESSCDDIHHREHHLE